MDPIPELDWRISDKMVFIFAIKLKIYQSNNHGKVKLFPAVKKKGPDFLLRAASSLKRG